MLQPLKNWPLPTNVKQVESFLGFANYHRDNIEHFAEIIEPFHHLVSIKIRLSLVWLPIHDKAFETLRNSILCATMLNHPEPNETLILDTDASDKSIREELSQMHDGVEKIISFASKVLTPQQLKYCTTRK